MKNEGYDIDDAFPYMMDTCVKLMKESLNDRFSAAGFDITSEQWKVLAFLWKQDGLTQQDLADRLGRSKVSVFNILKRMEKTNLVVRAPDPTDGRSKRVFLTSEGRTIQKELVTLAKENKLHMTEGLSRDEIEQMKKIIRKIITNLILKSASIK